MIHRVKICLSTIVLTRSNLILLQVHDSNSARKGLLSRGATYGSFSGNYFSIHDISFEIFGQISIQTSIIEETLLGATFAIICENFCCSWRQSNRLRSASAIEVT